MAVPKPSAIIGAMLPRSSTPPKNVELIRRQVRSFATARYGHPDGPIYRDIESDSKLLALLSTDPPAYSPDTPSTENIQAWNGYLKEYAGWHRSLLEQWINPPPKEPVEQQESQGKQEHHNDKSGILKFDISSTCSAVNVKWSDHPSVLWSAVNTMSNGIACVVCSPYLSWDVLQILGSRYGIHPSFFVPPWVQPLPIDINNDSISIRLGFPRDPENLWLLDDSSPRTDENYRTGRIEMDSYRLWVKDVDGIPSIVCFASSDDVPKSMLKTFGNPYWTTRFRDWKSRDRRLLPLPFLWYTVRRWDEICEAVSTFAGLSVSLSRRVIHRASRANLAHILFSEGLMNNLKLVINGLKEGCTDELVLKECQLLLNECARLEFRRRLQGDRVQNVIDMIYSHATTRASEAAVRDSRDMMQVSRLTMLFLPASVMAGIFGINSTTIDEHTSLVLYLVLTVPLTLMTIWLFVAMQIENYFRDFPKGAWYRAFWPYYIFRRKCNWVDPV
ncbi:hypothetical protein ONZ45_g5140 [Pleurotus djamor]|nr:hypothetical protein ONZ45_g5140 [Pleurotus djamor]